MEVRIGVQQTARELAFESKETQDKVSKAVAEAIDAGTTLVLSDDKGRQYIVPADRVAYVELGESAPRRVGFGAA